MNECEQSDDPLIRWVHKIMHTPLSELSENSHWPLTGGIILSVIQFAIRMVLAST